MFIPTYFVKTKWIPSVFVVIENNYNHNNNTKKIYIYNIPDTYFNNQRHI